MEVDAEEHLDRPVREVDVAQLDRGDVGEAGRPNVLAELATLCANGLTGLGKTRATASVMLRPLTPDDAEATAREPRPRDGAWIVTLQSPALLVPPGDPPAMAGAVMALLHDADRRQAVGRQGRELVERKYGIVAVNDQVDDVYRAVLQLRSAPASGGGG